MSQSDYIKYKRTQNVLKTQSKLQKVLNENDYISYETYGIETTIPNTKLRPSRLIPSNKISVMEIDRVITSCPTFTLCKNTHNRANRVLNTVVSANAPPTFKSGKLTGKQLGVNGKEPIENSIKCTFNIKQNGKINTYIQRNCTCYKLPKLCKCGTSICEGTLVVV